MKKQLLLAGLATIALVYSCSKKDKDKFICDLSDSTLPSDDSAVVFIPNAFSPNGDGLNDQFGPRFRNIKSIAWSVYDDQNHQLYSTTDTGAYVFWQGSGKVDKGMVLYHYKVTAVSNQGNTFSQCGNFYSFTCIPPGYNGVDTLVFSDQFNPNAPKGYLLGVSQEISISFYPCQ